MNEIDIDPNEVMHWIGTTTYRNAFEFGLDHEVSRYNMIAFCEEFFDMNDSNDVWQLTHVCVDQIKKTRKALQQVKTK